MVVVCPCCHRHSGSHGKPKETPITHARRRKWRTTQWRHRAKEIDGVWGHRENSSASSTASKIVTPCSTAEEERRGCDAIHAHQRHHHDHHLAPKANHSWQQPTRPWCIIRPIAGFGAGLRAICNKPDGETDVLMNTQTHPPLCWHLPQGERGAAATAMQCLSACTSWCLALLGPT